MKSSAICLVLGSMHVLVQAEAVDLEGRLARAITNTVYQAPTRAGLTEATELFRLMLQGHCANEQLKTRWAAMGFELQEITTTNESLWLLSEPAGKESGRGWYLFRTNLDCSIALEAPHARNDIHTGMIALRLFLTGQTRVLAASTITRHRADMAHLDDTFFQAFTVAFAEACPTGLVVQLHGFGFDDHPQARGDIIASAGTRLPEPWLSALVQQLKQATKLLVLAYPRDTKQLGATLNAQGRALQKTRNCRFLHLEMSKELRDRLTRDGQLGRTILNCLSSSKTQ